MYKAYAASEAAGKLKPFEYDPGQLGQSEVEIAVEHCGICHSDLSMLDNQWGLTKYPFVPGHEIVGTISEVGKDVASLQVGERVGLGWHAGYCLTCPSCLGGDHNLCANAEGVIVGRHGGFADKVRAKVPSVIKLPQGIDVQSAGPLFCGGITVFNPLIQFGIKPTDKVAVIGIGGLGHMALQFLNAWGCEVTAFTSSESKKEEAKKLGAHHTVNSRSTDDIAAVAGTFDLIISTVNIRLDWNSYVAALRPKGRLHLVGATVEPLDLSLIPMMMGQRTISSSPVGSPANIAKMLEFAVRHNIKPVIETFSFDQANEAMDRLRSGKTHYRVVLTR